MNTARALAAALLAALAFAVPAQAHDGVCLGSAQCRQDRTRLEVRYHAWTTWGAYPSHVLVGSAPWGAHSWRGTFRYQVGRRACAGSMIVSAHTGRALRTREQCGRAAGVARAASVCHVRGNLPAPDNAWQCTPGSYMVLTRAQVCASKPRPDLPAAVRRDVLARYGRPDWTGRDGEIDHRVPLFLGGKTERANLWPEPGSIPNAKDRVEFRVYRRVCFSDPRPMRVRTARRLFLADWRHAYRVWREDGEL